MDAAIDLYSDTKTRPTVGMRKAIAEAEVGDEQHLEDPTVQRLVERTAALLGHEAAVFLPSGTMANEIAILVHCRPGDELIAHADSHILNFEGGAAAALAGVMARPLAGEKGMFGGQALSAAIRPDRRHLPRSRLVAVEQTTNLGGGAVWPPEAIQEVVAAAKSRGLSAHLDGARLMNAAVAKGLRPDEFALQFDSVFLDFTKGLGAPFGAILAGSTAFIEEAWRWKQRLGGSMRQAGMLAAGCLYALDHHVERLTEDHANARLLASELTGVDGITVDPPETNMVFIDVGGTDLSAEAFNAQLAAHDVRVSVQGATRLRAVTHLDVSRDQILLAAKAIRAVAASSRDTKDGVAAPTADMIHPYYSERRAEIRTELENGMAVGRSEFERLVPSVPFDEISRLASDELDGVLALVPYAGGAEGRMTPFFMQGAGVIALGRALRKLGVPAKDIGSLMRTVFLSKFYELRREERLALGRKWLSPENQAYLREEAVKSQERVNPGDFVYEFIEGGERGPGGRPFDFGIDYLECGFCKMSRIGGDEDLLPHICAMDKESYGIRGVDFQRSTTLAAGDDRCDFRFSGLSRQNEDQPEREEHSGQTALEQLDDRGRRREPD